VAVRKLSQKKKGGPPWAKKNLDSRTERKDHPTGDKGRRSPQHQPNGFTKTKTLEKPFARPKKRLVGNHKEVGGGGKHRRVVRKLVMHSGTNGSLKK